jgi:uncharacterized membrane protein SirB2
MANNYILATMLALIVYIVLFDTFIKLEKWSVSSKRKFRKIYISTWIILYFIYLICILATPETRPLFKEHIVFGAFLHFTFAFFTWIITIY